MSGPGQSGEDGSAERCAYVPSRAADSDLSTRDPVDELHKAGHILDGYEQRAQVAAMNGLRFGHMHRSERLAEGQLDIVALTNADYSFVRNRVLSGIHVIRNPLDLICSAYYSHLSTHSLEGWPELELQRTVLKSVSKPEGLMLTLTFLERSDFYSGAIGPLLALRHWDFSDEAFSTLRM